MALARYIDDTCHAGLRAVRLENEHLLVTILPDLAGKIVDITDRRTGRNWLWRNPDLAHGVAAGGASFGAALDSGGWDEILLSVAPCVLQLSDGTACQLPDHGDLVGRPWALGAGGLDEDGNAFCELTASGRALPYWWRRRVALAPDRAWLRFDYHLENTGDAHCPFYWCPHPLITGEPGMRVLLAQGQEFRVDSSHGLPAAAAGASLRWPSLPVGVGRSIDLSRFGEPASSRAGFALKIFVRSTDPAEAVVESADGCEQFILRYDGSTVPWLGLWINNRGWTGSGGRPHLNLGVEPSTASCDSLVESLARDRLPMLRPGERRQWSLELQLRSMRTRANTVREVRA